MSGSPPATWPDSVLLAGGGSAGHVSPLLALADCLRAHRPDMAIAALGTATGLEARLVPARGYPLHVVPKVPLPRRLNADLVRLPSTLRAAVAAADRAIEDTGAAVVVGFGGYVSTPAYLAARRRHLPIVIHEQNARPGLANRLGARLTPFVGVTFPSTTLAHRRVVGMPLRAEIARLDRSASRAAALEHFALADGYPTLLVTGGSLGAQRLNGALAGSVEALRAAGIQVLHLTGAGKTFEVAPGEGPPYVVRPYSDRMDLAYAVADLVLARSGANTVCELTAVGLPGVYVPLPVGNGEQRLNAADVVAAGGGLLVEDAAVSASWVSSTLIPLLRNEARLAELAAAAASVGERDGDEQLAELVALAFAAPRPGRS